MNERSFEAALYIHTHFSAISLGVSAVSISPSTVWQNSSRAVLLSSQTMSFEVEGIFCLTFLAIPKPMFPRPMKPYVASGGEMVEAIVDGRVVGIGDVLDLHV